MRAAAEAAGPDINPAHHLLPCLKAHFTATQRAIELCEEPNTAAVVSALFRQCIRLRETAGAEGPVTANLRHQHAVWLYGRSDDYSKCVQLCQHQRMLFELCFAKICFECATHMTIAAKHFASIVSTLQLPILST